MTLCGLFIEHTSLHPNYAAAGHDIWAHRLGHSGVLPAAAVGSVPTRRPRTLPGSGVLVRAGLILAVDLWLTVSGRSHRESRCVPVPVMRAYHVL